MTLNHCGDFGANIKRKQMWILGIIKKEKCISMSLRLYANVFWVRWDCKTDLFVYNLLIVADQSYITDFGA